MAESPKTQIPLLPPAADVRNEDLFIIRQGVEDKNLTFDLLKEGISAADVGAISNITQINTSAPIRGGGLLNSTLTISIQDATTSQKGSTQYSTVAEVQSGTVNNKSVTPFGLAAMTATETRAGLVERATDSESLTDDTTRYINAKQLNSRVNTRTTEARVLELINQERQKLWPIGSIYTNAAVNTNPASLLGFGTWQQFGQGRVLVGVDTGNSNFNTLGKNGGSQNAVVVAHQHPVTNTTINGRFDIRTSTDDNKQVYNPSGALSYVDGGGTSQGTIMGSSINRNTTRINFNHTHSHTASQVGENGNNKNLQPYITVYMWRRTG